ncbi:hypothetical protein [Tessaracoccus antarcticus]|nr:hypothetical protein [Tessaracoccus antarcticus]
MVNMTWVLAVVVGVSVAVGLLTDVGWPGFVIGAVLSFSLWVMLFLGPANFAARSVPASQFAWAALGSVALGYLIFRLGGENPVMWATGFIAVGVVAFGFPAVRRGKSTNS